MDRKLTGVAACTLFVIVSGAAAPAWAEPAPERVVAGLEGASGSAVGPGNALYVTEGAAGRISRINPRTGAITTFASGLPRALVGIGGAIDLAFLDGTAYVLVTLVGPDVGGSDVVGIYRVDGPTSFTVIANIGAWAVANPPRTAFDVPTGLQYAIDVFRGGFLVTDGHHNRVLRVTLDGAVSEWAAFDNIVPTGLAVAGRTVYMAQAGPTPHAPADGKVVSIDPWTRLATEVASGAPLLVDVERRRGHGVFALSQGVFPAGAPPAAAALPDTGSLVKVRGNGTLRVVADGLDRPTSLEFIRDAAYVTTLTGEVWRIHVGRR